MPRKNENEAIQTLKNYTQTIDMAKNLLSTNKDILSGDDKRIGAQDRINKFTKAVVNHAEKQNFWTKAVLRYELIRLSTTRSLSEEQKEILKSLNKQFGQESKNADGSKKAKTFKEEAFEALKGEYSIFKQLNKLTDDTGGTVSETLIDAAGGTYPTDEEFVNAVASLSTKINKIIELLQLDIK